jgi:predicted transcriptional regulator
MILHRDHQVIVTKILESTGRNQGVTKTKIMNVVKLSYSQLKTYLPYLQRKELISYNAKRRIYRTTMKGERPLELYKEMNELVPLYATENINS